MNKLPPIKDLETIELMKTQLLKEGKREWFLFVLGINVGVKISLLLNLKVKDIKNQTHIVIKENNSSKIKRIFINEKLKNDIEIYTAGMNDEAYVFKSYRSDRPIKRVQAYKILKKVATEAGVSSFGPETLRSTFAYHFYQQTQDIELLQYLFNHSSVNVTLKFLDVSKN
ncbi:tyrosine-type recombinase/integrase [Cytobacillus gottheilii]|uniref:tyrosine-type recombinase/integrase n=1 Tax=Cytobacillus gottheilii TaxID=859144 RepID=UPI00082A7607|nr:tyrosine-type recombinase/integrase [Cytobacillus gottheilii]